jgi:hypothetical protein
MLGLMSSGGGRANLLPGQVVEWCYESFISRQPEIRSTCWLLAQSTSFYRHW